MGKRNRNRKPARRLEMIDPKPVILIITEGKVTEPEYLHGLLGHFKNPRITIRIEGDEGTAPKTLVQAAKRYKKEAEEKADRHEDDTHKYDQVWCLFDVDQHPNIPGAKDMARDNGIKLAISNPCFEIWLWLHFADQPGIQHRKNLQKKLGKYLSGYSEKNKHIDFNDCKDGYQNAVHRAKRLDEEARLVDDPGKNPSTDVWKLTEIIRTR